MAMSDSDALDEFHIWLCRRGRGRSADRYRAVARNWMEDPDEIEQRMTSSEYSPNYRRFLIACVRVWAKYVKDGELLLRLENIKRPAAIAKSAREPLESDKWFEIRDIIDNNRTLSNPTRLVCSIIALRGMRCGDVLRITKKDISKALDTGTLVFESKGERWQNFNADPMIEYLEGLRDCQWGRGKRVRNLVCPGSSEENAQATAGRQIRVAFDRIAKAVGMKPEDLYAHRFRHTYATLFLQQMQGDPEAIFKLQQQMGWASLETASNYLRRSRRKELDAIEEQLLKR